MSQFLEIVGAKTHNLKDVSIKIPKNKLVVITGVSWSGKSSLAFDTIYAEGQRRYLESLSTYARMIISGINEDTKVDEIRGLSPTISINQKTVSSNPRSTVGTITEIYDFYRLLYTTIGVQKCPNHPHIVLKKHTINDIVKFVDTLPAESRFHILAPLFDEEKNTSVESVRKTVLDMGYIRFQVGDDVYSVGDEDKREVQKGENVSIVIDRLVKKEGEEKENFHKRLRDSLELAYKTGKDILEIYVLGENKRHSFSAKASCPVCDYRLQDLTISNFSFNSHYGACEMCHGIGSRVAFLEENIINPRLSLAEGAILPWSQHAYYMEVLNVVCDAYKVSMSKPYNELTDKQRQIVLFWVEDTFEITHGFEKGKEKVYKTRYEGVIPNLSRRYHEGDPNDVYMKRISQFATEIECPECNGHRLKKEYLHVLVGELNIGELADMSVKEARKFFNSLPLTTSEKHIVKGIFKNICERLEFLSGVGLDYMSLSRRANTLSGGESQRIRLATQIGTRLEGIVYVLDEPSIGLHPRDNDMLIANIKKLSEIGNTVIVVEHDEDIMEAADYIVDIGPGAWKHGGEIISSGTFQEICNDPNSETGMYLSNKKIISLPENNRKPSGWIKILNAHENNLQNIDVDIPLGMLTVVTGVSGSGKSSLIMDILANRLMYHFHSSNVNHGKADKILGLDNLDKAIIIDQSPIGKTPHSNIATYTGVFTFIREVFASSLEAQKRGYNVGRFSFNTRWGRCEVCEGSGVKKIEMHFLPDVYVECEACQGTRYNPETLEVKYKGKNIAEVLSMTIEEALEFFASFPRIKRILEVLFDVGLGYIQLGQSAPTLSGWEAQRIKLAFDLSKRSTSKTLYILDEPTTGLHFSDVQKLLVILDKLVEKGNSVLVIEHNLDVIANADYIIDIGPDGGDGGGWLVYSGKRSGIIEIDHSNTGKALRRYWEKKWLTFKK